MEKKLDLMVGTAGNSVRTRRRIEASVSVYASGQTHLTRSPSSEEAWYATFRKIDELGFDLAP